MEYTLGKRISANRKRLGLTQEQMAEKLSVTAQAVSKWENNQSCPDITMLPKLAQIFGVTTDELLGLGPQTVHAAEIVTENGENEPEGIHIRNDGLWELHWDGGRKGSLMLAVWVSLIGLLLLLLEAGMWKSGAYENVFWNIFCSTGLIVFGLFGIYPKFSMLRLACAMVGGYYLLSYMNILSVDNAFLLPLLLILLGIKLFCDAAGKPKTGRFHFTHDGKSITGEDSSYCRYDGECFHCAGSFGEKRHLISLPRLAGGDAHIHFGEMILDLTACQELAEDALVEISCSFGSMEVLVPRQWRVIPVSSTSFAAVDIQGTPAPDAREILNLTCDASFGSIEIRYI